MKIVHAASELFPFVKTGGLADAAAALSQSLARQGNPVAVFLPGYRAVLEHPRVREKARKAITLGIEMDDQFHHGEVLEVGLEKNLTLYLVCRDEFFDRRHPYGVGGRDYEDNGERFLFFAKAVVEALSQLRLKADIVHCHDWQTAMIPLLLRYEERRRSAVLAGRTLLTIHNLAFQGIFPMRLFPLTNLPEELRGMDGLEYYGQINYLKAGILFSDSVTTVSPTYGKEILTPEFGCGLEGVLKTRKEDLFCQVNGIDTGLWNPADDPHLPAAYGPEDLSGKSRCQEKLLKQTGLKPKGKGPVYGMICRFTPQKGLELIRANGGFFAKRDCRLVVLGSGGEEDERWFKELAAAHPGKISVNTGMNEALSHLIEAGADFFLMPSTFEPCGLNQMYSMRYGTVPLVSRVGGLADTVTDIGRDPEEGTGILFPPTAEGLAEGLSRSLDLYADRPAMERAIRNGMSRDLSWDNAAAAYLRHYESLL